MELGSCRLNMLLTFLCAFSLLISTAVAESSNENHKQQIENTNMDTKEPDSITKRQDNGFNFMNYFIGNRQQQQQQAAAQPNQQQANYNQQQLRQSQQPLTLQQQHQLQQQQLLQQQLQQHQQLQQLQQQQLLQQQGSRSNDVYQDSTAQQQQQQQIQQQPAAALNRQGGYGGIGIGSGYSEAPKAIGISIGGGGKPGNSVGVGSIISLLPRIINILSGGGKVMFGVELGNNFYFGPVGAKPLYSG